jgi:nucleotide-binding universal stress UspA family protein
MRPILLATDGSPSAETATATAVRIAKATGWPLRVVTAWTVPTTSYGFAPMTVVPALADVEEEHARAALATAVETARADGVTVVGVLRRGVPVEEICTEAEKSEAALVVLGAHGWGPLKRFVFGSVSSGVLRHAPCPVLVVRGDARVKPEVHEVLHAEATPC